MAPVRAGRRGCGGRHGQHGRLQAAARSVVGLELGIETLHKHREALDSTYRAGIQTIEQTFRIGDAKSVEDSRKVVEDLWRKLFDLQKVQAESQFRDFQEWFQKSAGLVREMPQA